MDRIGVGKLRETQLQFVSKDGVCTPLAMLLHRSRYRSPSRQDATGALLRMANPGLRASQDQCIGRCAKASVPGESPKCSKLYATTAGGQTTHVPWYDNPLSMA
jgi:hypothetical protein